MTDKTFDPTPYVIKLKGKDYLQVAHRLLWFRTLHPDGLIETELVSHDYAQRVAVFKASVCLKEGSATGYGMEEASDFGDYLEKAETKALGRALAALGFGTQFTADYEDAAEPAAERVQIVDTPQAPRTPVDRSGAPQRRALAERLNVPAEQTGARADGDGQGQTITREEWLKQRKAGSA